MTIHSPPAAVGDVRRLMARVLLALMLCLVAPLANAGVIGFLDAAPTSGAGFQVKGWACSVGVASSIKVHVYVGGTASVGALVANVTANVAGEPGISISCGTTGVPHRYAITLPASVRQQHANKLIYVYGISPDGGSNPLLANSGEYAVPPSASGIMGVVESVAVSGNGFQITGWACSGSYAGSVNVDVYAGGGSGSGAPLGRFLANVASEAAISDACGTAGVPHRFAITLPAAVRREYAARLLYLYGLSPNGGSNLLLANSGTLSVPGAVHVARTYTYNPSGELCKSIEPETGATLYGYDGAGNLAWSASGLLATTACDSADASVTARKATRMYDARSRIQALSFPDGRGNLRYSYQANGLPKSLTAHNDGVDAGRVTTTYAHNHRGLLELETMEVGSISWPIDYGYNALGHLQAKRYNGQLIDYAPNALGQATQVGVYANSASYYPNGALKQFTYGNGIVHTMTQNLRGLPARSWDEHGTTEILDDRYSYDGNANVAAITDGLTGSNGRGNRKMTYDGLNRLTKAQSLMFGDESTDAAAFRYDALDNLTWLFRNSRPNESGRDWDYFYDGANRLTNIEQHSDGATVVALDYDAQGNLIQKSSGSSSNLLFDFDFGNRLRKTSRLVSGQAVQAVSTYLYDGQGRRVRDFNSGVTGGGVGSKYSQYSQDGQLLVDLDGRTGKTHEYMYLAGSLVAIREIAGSVYTTTYQHTDALGSPVAVTNASKVVLKRSEYEPYGMVLAPLPASDGPGFTGHVLDVATSMNYMQQRYYDPELGRFLSVDPVAVDTRTGWNLNRYSYAADNPYRFVDPDGRCIGTRIKSSPLCGGSDKRLVGPPAVNEGYDEDRGRKLTEKPVEGRINKKDDDGTADGGYDPTGDKKLRSGGARPHKGIDIDAPTGTDVKAAGSGKVQNRNEPKGYGKWTILDHGDGLTTRYAHLSNQSQVSGTWVQAGDVIGQTGTTGNLPAGADPHLHFEVRLNGDPLDPTGYFNYQYED